MQCLWEENHCFFKLYWGICDKWELFCTTWCFHMRHIRDALWNDHHGQADDECHILFFSSFLSFFLSLSFCLSSFPSFLPHSLLFFLSMVRTLKTYFPNKFQAHNTALLTTVTLLDLSFQNSFILNNWIFVPCDQHLPDPSLWQPPLSPCFHEFSIFRFHI